MIWLNISIPSKINNIIWKLRNLETSFDMCLDELIQKGELNEKDDTCLYHMFHTFSNW
jgi:hypothetical protein